jgi:hypothetical protein
LLLSGPETSHPSSISICVRREGYAGGIRCYRYTNSNITCLALTESGHNVVVGPVACIEKILFNKPLGQCHTTNADIRSAKIKKILASREATADVTVRSGWAPCTLTL